MAKQLDVFVTGGTGYMGSRLTSTLLARGHRVRAVVHQTSLGRVPEGAPPVMVWNPNSAATGLHDDGFV